MKALLDTADHRSERAFLVAMERTDQRPGEVVELLAELAELAQTRDIAVIGQGVQRLDSPHSATFIGSGKARTFAAEASQLGADTVIFDDELTGAQARNLEEIFGMKVLDRTALILEIFASRARSKEGKLQVELAQLQYLLPRLTRYWTHLSRQRGATGSIGGEGESQLEADRRKTLERMDRIRDELEVVRRQRGTRRSGRQRHPWPLASIVGYTNAGKSTLLNQLTGAGVLAEDKLFATLDPTTRRLRLPSNQNVLLSDTVGFIRKLPHGLVESFKATLEEVVEADLLLHVVDVSHPQAMEHVRAVGEVLAEIGAAEKPMLMVFNKIDQIPSGGGFGEFTSAYPHSVAISAKTGQGFQDLFQELAVLLRPVREVMELSIPHHHSKEIARLHAIGQVMEQKFIGDDAWFRVRIPPDLRHEFEPYRIQSPSTASGTDDEKTETSPQPSANFGL